MNQKLLSGRLFLTVMAGLALLVLTISHCFNTPSISPDALTAIISMTFISYFQKNRDAKIQ